MERICCNCGKRIGLFNSKIYSLKDGYFCMDCMKDKGVDVEWFEHRYGNLTTDISCEDFSNLVTKEGITRSIYKAQKDTLRENFTITTKIGDQILIDEYSKTFKINPTIYEFSQIISYELYEDNSTIMSGGVGRAIIGDALFGRVGAVIGVATRKSQNICSNMEIVITLKDEYHPVATIKLIESDTNRNSEKYKTAIKEARNIISKLDNITHANKETAKEDVIMTSVADEIRKFKNLLDDGIITEEEFIIKKKQLLNL